ncbi:restriction endonuclease subunit S [Pseudidiomarina sp. PP-1MA]|uniref:Restriction endonuclease subunit S n=1 Tax=Pseudidiomarina sp. PP-1MA TaxID=3237706 RepID=A0AB39X6R8_9GAMM
MVPEGWTEEYVKGLVRSLDAGVSVNSEDDGNENATHKILKTSCVSYGYFKSDETKSVIEQSEIARLREPVIANSIIISRMNTPALVGANAYVEIALNNTYLPDRLWQLKPKNKVVEMRWLAYWLGSAHTRYRLSNLGTGTSGSMKNITKSDVLNLALLVPPLPEQKKIAQILSTWDKAISTTEQLLANSQQQKKALMQQLLTGKKRLLDENGVRFSGEWKFVVFSDAFKIANQKSTQVKSSDYLSFGDVPIVDQGQKLIAGFCNNSEHYKDIPVIIFGDHTRCIKWVDFAFCPGADGTQILVSRSTLDIKFGYFLLSHVDIPNLGYSRHMRVLKELEFKIPSDLREQHSIAAVLTLAENEIKKYEQKLDALKQEKKALMQQLLTGKRRVKVDEEAA